MYCPIAPLYAQMGQLNSGPIISLITFNDAHMGKIAHGYSGIGKQPCVSGSDANVFEFPGSSRYFPDQISILRR